MGKDTVFLIFIRTIAEVTVINRQTALVAENNSCRVLQAEHMGKTFTTCRAGTCKATDDVVHNESVIID